MMIACSSRARSVPSTCRTSPYWTFGGVLTSRDVDAARAEPRVPSQRWTVLLSRACSLPRFQAVEHARQRNVVRRPRTRPTNPHPALPRLTAGLNIARQRTPFLTAHHLRTSGRGYRTPVDDLWGCAALRGSGTERREARQSPIGCGALPRCAPGTQRAIAGRSGERSARRRGMHCGGTRRSASPG